ncbi:MAG TPA: PIG-L family deacetylase [Jatrophihabitans sp.]
MTPSFAAPRSVLTLMAHPDDAELWAGGTLALCAAAGTTVTIAVPRHPDSQRNREAASGAAALGASLHQFEQPTVTNVQEVLLAVLPDVVITHPLGDVHPEHRHLAETVVAALPDVVIATGRPRKLYTADTYNSLTTGGPTPAHTIVDITGSYDRKLAALGAHASQPINEHFGPMAQTLGRLWGSRTRYAENFIPIPILGRLPAAGSL